VSPPTAAPGVQADGEVVSAVQWFEGSLEQAQAAAKAAGKRVFVDVGAYWCPPCRALDEQVFVRPEVGEALARGYVAVHIDAEKGEGPEVVARYRVQAYPTLLVLEAEGLERGRLVDELKPEELLAKLEEIARGGDVLAALEAAVAAGPDDLEARYRLGNAYALAARRTEAEAELQKVIAGDPDNKRGLAARAMSDRAAFLVAKQDGDPERAIALYRELQQKYPRAKESLRAYRQIGRELHKLGRDDEAIASLEAMVAAEPDNVDLKSAYGWFSFRERCRPADGLKAVDAGVSLDPRNADLFYLRAELKHQLGDAAGALVAIREAAAIEPESAFYKRQVRRFADLAGAGGA
jgi:tetratricopeptide (TPR) repeat protein